MLDICLKAVLFIPEYEKDHCGYRYPVFLSIESYGNESQQQRRSFLSIKRMKPPNISPDGREKMKVIVLVHGTIDTQSNAGMEPVNYEEWASIGWHWSSSYLLSSLEEVVEASWLCLVVVGVLLFYHWWCFQGQNSWYFCWQHCHARWPDWLSALHMNDQDCYCSRWNHLKDHKRHPGR